MARLKGSKNRDFETSKEAILHVLKSHVLAAQGDVSISFRKMAEIAGISVPTLRHYFPDRTAALKEIMRAFRKDGEPHVDRAANFAPEDLQESLNEFAASFISGWRFGVSSIHQAGLLSGVGNSELGPAYVTDLLEPTVQALEMRLKKHTEQEIFPVCEYRHASISFIAPLFLALIHQDALFGKTCRPLDLDGLVKDHIERFIKAWGS